MSCNINIKRENVLHMSNRYMSSFFYIICDLVIENNLGRNKSIIGLLGKLDQDLWGAGNVYPDIADYFKNEKDLDLLINLIPFSYDKMRKRIKYFDEEMIIELEDFKNKLIEYKNELTKK